MESRPPIPSSEDFLPLVEGQVVVGREEERRHLETYHVPPVSLSTGFCLNLITILSVLLQSKTRGSGGCVTSPRPWS